MRLTVMISVCCLLQTAVFGQSVYLGQPKKEALEFLRSYMADQLTRAEKDFKTKDPSLWSRGVKDVWMVLVPLAKTCLDKDIEAERQKLLVRAAKCISDFMKRNDLIGEYEIEQKYVKKMASWWPTAKHSLSKLTPDQKKNVKFKVKVTIDRSDILQLATYGVSGYKATSGALPPSLKAVLAEVFKQCGKDDRDLQLFIQKNVRKNLLSSDPFFAEKLKDWGLISNTPKVK